MTDLQKLIDPERLTALFARLVAVDSPSFSEREMADTVASELAALGISVTEDGAASQIGGNAGNLTAFVPGDPDREPLLLAAHLDTVDPARGKKAVVQPDGRITSAGDTVLGADDLSAVAEILEVLRVLKENALPHRPLELVFFAAEEPYTVGSRHYDFSGIRARQAFIGDLAGAPGTAALRAPTILYFKITVHGRASHAGFAPEAGIHAVKIAAEAVAEIPLGRPDGETSVGIGTVNGGLAPNIVPAECVLQGEIRGYDNNKVRAAMENIRRVFTEKASKYGGSVTFEEEQRTTAYAVDGASEIADLFRRACKAVGLEAQFCDTFGGSDASSTSKAGIPSLVMSNGMHSIHSTSEWSRKEELAQTAALFLALATL